LNVTTCSRHRHEVLDLVLKPRVFLNKRVTLCDMVDRAYTVDHALDELLAHVRRFFGPLTPECSENGRKTMIACLIHVNPSDTI